MTTAREETWRQYASCAQVVNAEIFHPPRGGSTMAAKSICAACDVRERCLRYALDNGERDGIWGGLSAEERKAIRKARAAA